MIGLLSSPTKEKAGEGYQEKREVRWQAHATGWGGDGERALQHRRSSSSSPLQRSSSPTYNVVVVVATLLPLYLTETLQRSHARNLRPWSLEQAIGAMTSTAAATHSSSASLSNRLPLPPAPHHHLHDFYHFIKFFNFFFKRLLFVLFLWNTQMFHLLHLLNYYKKIMVFFSRNINKNIISFNLTK
jgi:hypothetical protein